ncbi:hypothetical protein EXIGLDRAFT_753153 [Exidia glandulosa HHB12029]|uniref:F-box domain-containing protein n=1 Tax=Exidia glandulosa HHB12029 TaxID=1314781 RepID=A0A165DZH0_EXIGL|nr:hypothetical protein EXIGLDRAFT_753153 [Exidia glandulosa HHB12029]
MASVRRVIEDAVSKAVAEELQVRNGLLAAHASLPTDIWSYIWRFLPMTSLVTASHVCSAWRLQLLGLPTLWTRLELTAGERPHLNTAGATARMAALTSRSGTLPLTLAIYDEDPDDATWQQIHVLKPYLGRLLNLEFVVPNAVGIVMRFLLSLDCQSSLRSLVVVHPLFTGFTRRLSRQWRRPHQGLLVKLPALVHLELGYTLEFLPTAFSYYLRTLQTTCTTLVHLALVLIACPQLEDIDVRVVGPPHEGVWSISPHTLIFLEPEPGSGTIYRDVQRSTARIHTVRLSGIHAVSESGLLELFPPSQSARRSYSLHFRENSISSVFHVFNDLKDPAQSVEVSFITPIAAGSWEHEIMVVSATRRDDMHREIALPFSSGARTMMDAWDAGLSQLHVAELVLSESLWEHAREQRITLPSIESVTLLIDSDPHALELYALMEKESCPCVWPALRTFRLVGKKDLKVRLAVETVFGLFRNLRLPRPLGTLYVEGITFIGDVKAIHSMEQVEKVVYV